MTVTTIPEANVILTECGCCLMPVGEAPRVENESIEVTVALCGTGAYEYTEDWDESPCSVRQTKFRKLAYTVHESRSGVGGFTTVTETTYALSASNSCQYTNAVTDGFGSGEIDPGNSGITMEATVYSQGGNRTAYFFKEEQTGSADPDVTWNAYLLWEYSDAPANPLNALISDADGFIASAFADVNFTCTGLVRGSTSTSITQVLSQTTCATISPSEPVSLKRRQSRLRVGVPSNYSTNLLPKTIYGLTWQYIAAFKPWWDWHDGGRVGSAPANGVVLVTPANWQWGGNMSTQFSDWFDIPLEDQSIVETRVANMQYTHYLSTRFGSLPVNTGPQVSTA